MAERLNAAERETQATRIALLELQLKQASLELDDMKTAHLLFDEKFETLEGKQDEMLGLQKELLKLQQHSVAEWVTRNQKLLIAIIALVGAFSSANGFIEVFKFLDK